MSSATGSRVARKPHTCDYCDQRIEKGEQYEAVTLFPSRDEVDVVCTHRSHLLCAAFWREVLYDDYWPEAPLDWDEAKREGGWDEWKANREMMRHD